MNFLIIFMFISLLYYLYSFENKSIIFISLAIIYYIYYNNLLPQTFWKLSTPINKNDKFNFQKLDDLIDQYNNCELVQQEKIKLDIQKEINTIYFSFPNHQHQDISNYLKLKYNFI